jgi:enoyl-[acyl-carrier-protein] reductase (NADH)
MMAASFYLSIALFIIGIAFFLKSDADIALYLLPFKYKNQYDGKIVWITGASSGIGASLAENFVKLGATVIISARRLQNLEDVSRSSSMYGKAPFVLPLDVADIDAHESAYKLIVEKFGRVDILILNAGQNQRNTAVDTPLNDTIHLMHLNFISYVALTKIVLPKMIETKQGHVNMFYLFNINVYCYVLMQFIDRAGCSDKFVVWNHWYAGRFFILCFEIRFGKFY